MENQLDKREERYNPQKQRIPTNLVNIDGSALTVDTSPKKEEEKEQKAKPTVHRGRPASAKPAGPQNERRKLIRPSSAHWADFKTVKGRDGMEKLQVQKVRKKHEKGGNVPSNLPKPPPAPSAAQVQ